MKSMNIIVTGATGTVGSEVVRQAILDNDIHHVTLITRRTAGFNNPKVKEIIHHDFLNYNGLEDIFRQADACIWCLGISQSRVNKNDYFRITYEYAVAAAKAMMSTNPNMTFLFLSGEGADSSEKSRIRFAKVKGQTENALQSMGIARLLIFRPGGINPVVRDPNESRYKKFEIAGVRFLKWLAPSKVINTDTLAKAMLKSIKTRPAKLILSHPDIVGL